MTIGYIGKILDVNLSVKQVVPVRLEQGVVRDFLGGTGLGIKILYDEVGPDVDPLSLNNVVVIATGPLSGTTAPANGRTDAITKSPLTGILGRGNFGGWWGPRLKLAGFEAVVVRGKSDSPVYLWINDDVVELRSAEHLWGKDNWETTDALKKELGNDISVLSIGQAGENLVKFACPVADYYHAPGRSHVGCVMGAKKLKAIAVRGTGEVPIANPERFEEAVKDATDRLVSYPMGEFELRLTTGSNYLVRDAAKAETLPAKNFQTGVLPPDSDTWGLPESAQKHLKVERGCYGYHCPYARYYGCDLIAEVKEGPYAGLKLGGVCFSQPGWEWGAKCGIKSFPAMWKCRELCQRYGMDQTTPIPFAMELYDKGIITKADTDGLELNWGDEQAVQEMIGRIARREGFGDVLAEGSVRAAQKIGKGAEKYPLTIKGMEVLGVVDPRTATWAMNLGHLTGLRGGDDLDTTHIGGSYEKIPTWATEAGWSEEKYLRWLVPWLDMPNGVKEQIFGSPPKIDYLHHDNLEGKAALVKWCGDSTAIFNSLGLCMMASTSALGPTYFAELYSACTGWELTASEILKTGERIFNLMKAYIVREGLTRKDDDWPERFYQEPWPTGPLKGRVASREKIYRLLDEYYELRGWDKETGIPTKRRLVELKLAHVANELATWLPSTMKM